MGRVISFFKSMKAKKRFGQNFLIDNNIIRKISDNINATENDLIIEIGPGMGALTKELKNKNCKTICFEIDTDMKQFLSKLEDDKLKVIYNDILLVDLTKEIENISYNNLYVVGNLPYYITTPIIKHLIETKLKIKEMVFMVQEEVADRFTAKPKTKEYGSITLYLKYFFNTEKLFKVSKNCFNPVPKVESAIIKFTERLDKPRVDENEYFKLINDSFKMKRKTLKNNLSNYDFDIIKKVLLENGLSESSRAEEIPEDIYVKIYNSI